MTGTDYLSVTNLTSMIEGINDPRTEGDNVHRRWINRLPAVPARPGEIMVRVKHRVLRADIIADDAKARIQSSVQFQPIGVDIPNIKHGVGLNQATINTLDRLAEGVAGRDEAGQALVDTRTFMEDLVEGVWSAMNEIAVLMMLDRGLTYSNFGIQFAMNFGAPSELKVNSSPVVEANPTTSDVIDEILGLLSTARVLYGQTYNRMELSTSAFRAITNTTQYQQRVQGMLFLSGLTFAQVISNQDFGTMQQMLSRMLGGIQVVLVDDRKWVQAANGDVAQSTYLPERYVLFTNTADDNRRSTWDWADDIVSETILGRMAQGASVFGLQGMGRRRGMVGFSSLASHDMNPPGLNMWAVRRGFARKKSVTASASLDLGPITDLYPPIPSF